VRVVRRGFWFAMPQLYSGMGGIEAAGLIFATMRDGAAVAVDVGTDWSKAAREHLAAQGLLAIPVAWESESKETTRFGALRFASRRAQIFWRLREALDPPAGLALALPDDDLVRDALTAARWFYSKPQTIEVDCPATPLRCLTEALAMAWSYGGTKARRPGVNLPSAAVVAFADLKRPVRREVQTDQGPIMRAVQ
jgi:hypothetical protein